jgi:HlyD family secretion protein
VELMIAPKIKPAVSAVLCLTILAACLAAFASKAQAQAPAHVAQTDADEDERWLAVAPGRVEPSSGEIKIVAPVVGVVGEVLVKANDTVFAGEPLIRLTDNETQGRLAAADVQIALRKRVRNDESANPKAATRRKAEDAVADAEKVLSDARSSLDKAAVARRLDRGSDAEVEAARSAMARAQDHLEQQKAELRRIEADAPLPTQAEGQLNIARRERSVIEAAIEKLTIRAPTGGTVLQMNARVGELASPSTTRPLLLLADLSALRVRAEVDERDIERIKIGQPVVVRPVAFRERAFAGKVSFIARRVEAEGNNARGQLHTADVGVVEVLVDVAEPGPLLVGMKVDVYFSVESASRQ